MKVAISNYMVKFSNHTRCYVYYFELLQSTFWHQARLSYQVNRLARHLNRRTLHIWFPPTLRPHCSSLLEKVASGASELDAWAAVAHLIIEFSSLRVPAAPTPEESDITNDEMESSILYKLREKWTSEYLPESLHALQDTIRETRAKWIGNNHFTPRL